jgi:beta-lactamase superfamily II metal-dependent hydrolase
MKLIVFDVNNGACSLAVCPNGYSLMVDCGCHEEKMCPVEKTHQLRHGLGMTDIKGHSLTLLHITHPDEDHVRNAKKISEKLPPYLLHRRKYEEFDTKENIYEDYKKKIDLRYRADYFGSIDWGFDQNITFRIPMQKIFRDDLLNKKIKNNSSILRFIEYKGYRILFGGDLEKEGWDWLAENDQNFIDTMKRGLDILIAPHHGHKSGFPNSLFKLTGQIRTVVHSKGSEDSSIIGTETASQYYKYTIGVNYKKLNSDTYNFAKILTTRSNGDICFFILGDGRLEILTSK